MSIEAFKVLEVWGEGFSTGNSGPLAEILHDDFLYVGPTLNRSKEETLHWVSTTPEMRLSDTEVFYENDEVFVGFFNIVRSEGRGTGWTMCFGRFKEGKVSYFRAHMAPTSG